MEVVVATRNKHKFREISQILKDSNIEAESLENFPAAPEVVEDGKTFLDNAKKKALTIARFTRRLTVADDSGLVVEFLNGAPGVYSARFAGENAGDEENNEKLLGLLKGVSWKKRKAQFVCYVAIADTKGIIGVVNGAHCGYISLKPAGKNGFGYDPLFFSPKMKKIFAQLSPALKNKVSHRAIAFNKAKKVILTYIKSRKEK